jgi:hypothetical protein
MVSRRIDVTSVTLTFWIGQGKVSEIPGPIVRL